MVTLAPMVGRIAGRSLHALPGHCGVEDSRIDAQLRRDRRVIRGDDAAPRGAVA